MNIFLHQDDLRVHDNRGLAEAASHGDVIPVYIDDPTVQNQTGQNKRAFRVNALRALHESHQALGGCP